MGKDGNRSERENCRKDDTTVAIDLLGALRLLLVLENRRHQDFDERKENEQVASIS